MRLYVSRSDKNFLAGLTRGESMWILKSPVIMSSEGEGLMISRSEEKSVRNCEVEEEGGL